MGSAAKAATGEASRASVLWQCNAINLNKQRSKHKWGKKGSVGGRANASSDKTNNRAEGSRQQETSLKKCEKNILNLIIEAVWRLCDLYTPRNLFAIRNLSRHEGALHAEQVQCVHTSRNLAEAKRDEGSNKDNCSVQSVFKIF